MICPDLIYEHLSYYICIYGLLMMLITDIFPYMGVDIVMILAFTVVRFLRFCSSVGLYILFSLLTIVIIIITICFIFFGCCCCCC